MAIVSSEQIINVVDPIASVLEEELPDEIVAEISKLEQENTDYIKSLDDLFGNVKYDTVSEFAQEFPNFDVLNYVDLGLDSLLDDGIADVIETIDSNTGGPVISLNEPNSMANDGDDDYFMIVSQSETSLEIQTTMAAPDEELDSLKSQIHKQQMMQEKLNSFNAVEEMKPQQKKQEVDEVSMMEVSTQVQQNSVENCNVTAPFSDSVKEERIENEVVEHALECDQGNVITKSEKIELDEGMRHPECNSKQITVPLRRSSRCSKPNRTYINDTYGKKLTDAKSIRCQFCKKSLRYKSNLTAHLMIHLGKKPFVCDVCNLSFRQKSNLLKHRQIHTGKRRYKCQHCKESFRLKSDLSIHITVHTGEKLHNCMVCQKSFRFKWNFTRHFKLHANEQKELASL